ncbi:MAG: MerR family transcriptional regulator [Thiomicrorhabdus sp.]|nr:MerR family transcriptional regulator [Thiomicrorhabdus sp.]MCF6298605.1 MerR family transcriptional regulator [Thiomicrorhabdus sp.]
MANLNQESLPITQLLSELPDKKYFTIGEVAKICQLKSHVLRYWEQVFPQLEPSKRRGRRYYQRADLELLLEIKSLLHEQGFTIPGAKVKLAKKSAPIKEEMACSEQSKAVEVLQLMQQELQSFRAYIKQRF